MKNKTIGFIALIAIIVLAIFLLWNNKEAIIGDDNGNEETGNQNPSPTPTPGSTPPGTPTPTIKRVRIVSPRAGEVWTRGKNYLVRWDTSSVTNTERAFINLIPTTKAITDFYAAKYTGIEMFNSGSYPAGFPPEGSFSYTVPQSLKAGTYQIVVLVGKDCNTDTKVRCIFDTSDGLITIK